MNRDKCLVAMFSVLATAIVGCSDGRGGHGTGRTGGPGDMATSQGPPVTSDGGTVDDGCSDQAKLVYVVDSDSTLYSFQPTTLAFTTVGKLSCPTQDFTATPFSMSVDRSAHAWVLYSSGEVFEVSTTDASCTATSHVVGARGLAVFGMGFASNAASSTNETLFVAGGDSSAGSESVSTFASMSVPALVPSPIGSVEGWPELTGTGAGELWGFFPSADATPRVSQLDKTSGADTKVYSLPSLQGTPTSWAFAFWGGSFYVFLAKDGDSSTSVYKVDAATGTLTTAKKNTGKTIVGAGVSTCAPIGPIN